LNDSAIPLDSVCQALAEMAPLALAESWDNVGLLVGDRRSTLFRVMTCLTLSPPVVAEAVQQSADLVIAHHPLPFKPLSKITSDTLTGAMLLDLISGGVAVYSAHTAFDSAAEGINQTWAQRLGLKSIAPLVESELASEIGSSLGSGRWGELPASLSLEQLVVKAAALVGATAPRRVGPAEQPVSRVAVACGSGGSFLAAARRNGCHALITGEATFHNCLEAESSTIGLGLLGHYPSERFAMEMLAADLSELFPGLTIWPSSAEHDPIAPVIL
jgi:dinuclear metal center YbgI/SA1388 family protein